MNHKKSRRGSSVFETSIGSSNSAVLVDQELPMNLKLKIED